MGSMSGKKIKVSIKLHSAVEDSTLNDKTMQGENHFPRF